MFRNQQLLKPAFSSVFLSASKGANYSSLAQAIPIRTSNIIRQKVAKPFRPFSPLLQQAPPQIAPRSAPTGRSRRDEEITARFVSFVDEEGQVHDRCRISDILSKFDRARYFLVEVDPTAKPNPVCRLLEKKAMFEKEKQGKKKKQTSPESVLKEIMFGWNVSPHDMEHKLNKAVQFLDKGNKVKIDIVYKKGQQRADKAAQNELVSTVEGMMDAYKLTKKPTYTGHNCSLQFERK